MRHCRARRRPRPAPGRVLPGTRPHRPAAGRTAYPADPAAPAAADRVSLHQAQPPGRHGHRHRGRGVGDLPWRRTAQPASDARIALGAVGPVPFRATEAENLLRGRELSPDALAQAAEAARNAATPIDDVRGTAAYRKDMVAALTRRTLQHCPAPGRRAERVPFEEQRQTGGADRLLTRLYPRRRRVIWRRPALQFDLPIPARRCSGEQATATNDRQRPRATGAGGPLLFAAGHPAGRNAADRHQEGVRRGRLRGLHRHPGRHGPLPPAWCWP